VSFVLPGRIQNDGGEVRLYMRVKRTIKRARLDILSSLADGSSDGDVIWRRSYAIATPPEMLTASFSPPQEIKGLAGITVRVMEE
jgi:hypothetical protein